MEPGIGRQAGSPDREVLAGPVERVTFHNPENSFCLLRIRARGHRVLVTVVRHAATVSPGEWITASGEWVNDRTHGKQFRARSIRTAAPSSVERIEKYLGSGMIRGIGLVYARKLVCAFGENVLDVIEAEPERLREVASIGMVRAKRITDAWGEQKVVREIMVFLHSHGVGTARAVRIRRSSGNRRGSRPRNIWKASVGRRISGHLCQATSKAFRYCEAEAKRIHQARRTLACDSRQLRGRAARACLHTGGALTDWRLSEGAGSG